MTSEEGKVKGKVKTPMFFITKSGGCPKNILKKFCRKNSEKITLG